MVRGRNMNRFNVGEAEVPAIKFIRNYLDNWEAHKRRAVF
jgi:hypothetical protein